VENIEAGMRKMAAMLAAIELMEFIEGHKSAETLCRHRFPFLAEIVGERKRENQASMVVGGDEILLVFVTLYDVHHVSINEDEGSGCIRAEAMDGLLRFIGSYSFFFVFVRFD
jgi:hypothetical protein